MIPAGCRIGSRRYRELKSGEQAALLRRVIHAVTHPNFEEPDNYTMFHEQHKDGRMHVHGVIFDVEVESMISAQLTINMQFGYAPNCNKLFFFKKGPNEGWDEYCQKQQDTIDAAIRGEARGARPAAPDVAEKEGDEQNDIESLSEADAELLRKITVDIFK